MSQTVGLVLSGGGSKGLAHIGVLKALEENGIPIDYITGTSAGALIGALYSAGWSPAEMEALVTSDKFRYMVDGKMEPEYVYYFKRPEYDASWISIKFNTDSVLLRNLPTNLVTPAALDYEMMAVFAQAEARANYNFDRLFVPFRCVASDVSAKKPVVFSSGHLNQAVRASMSYPFYLKPIKVDGKLLFDGGLYNNFPVDVMENDFNPDIILGSLVTSNALQADDEDIFNQLENMIVNKQDFGIACDQSCIIQPNLDGLTTFDFGSIRESIEAGYNSTIAKIDSIKMMLSRRVDRNELAEKRNAFFSTLPDAEFQSVEISGLKPRQKKYLEKTLMRKQRLMTLGSLKPRYYKSYTDEKIRFMYPIAQYDSVSRKFNLLLDIKKEKPFEISFGGNVSSRPVNIGFVGFKYHLLGRSAWTFDLSTSFGRFYNAGRGSIKFEPAARSHYYLEAEANIHRWDYYKSSTLFFEDKKPSYLVQEERYTGLNFAHSAGTKGKFILQGRYVQNHDSYYRTDNFTARDTSDKTHVYSITGMLCYVRNSLNKKAFANAGSFFRLSARYVNALERTIPGNTSIIRDTTERIHNWPAFKLEFQQYFFRRSNLHLGLSAEGVMSFQPFYGNYTATLLAAPAYMPISETKTLFDPALRTHQYASLGAQIIVSMTKNIDLRTEAYYYQPLSTLVQTPDGGTEYSSFLLKRELIISTIGVFHSPIGPVSLAVNFYPERPTPITFMFNLGYLIFNQKAFY